ncbi:MAG: hypothetical protein JWN44_133 [Myxococcales bacterium]|nr:hypothetical protein [Myxococcales bacterium]
MSSSTAQVPAPQPASPRERMLMAAFALGGLSALAGAIAVMSLLMHFLPADHW